MPNDVVYIIGFVCTVPSSKPSVSKISSTSTSSPFGIFWACDLSTPGRATVSGPAFESACLRPFNDCCRYLHSCVLCDVRVRVFECNIGGGRGPVTQLKYLNWRHDPCPCASSRSVSCVMLKLVAVLVAALGGEDSGGRSAKHGPGGLVYPL